MRVGLVCGDGLPVSGLLTVFRTVLDLGRRMGLVHGPVPADLGFAWRPDKPTYFPDGGPSTVAPEWMRLSSCPVPDEWKPAELADALTAVRDGVAGWDRLTARQRDDVCSLSGRLAAAYRRHFTTWLAASDVDWVFALNMTLSDAVPATRGLHEAAEGYFSRRRGGVVFWDHDLFGSCAIRQDDARLYPETPNEATPVPQANHHTRWVVISQALADETRAYPTDLTPRIVPNILPEIPAGDLEQRHLAACRQLDLDPRRPVLLNPVRVFGVKGVHLAVELLAALKQESGPDPYLLVFGALGEDPAYAGEVTGLADRLGVRSDVRWLDGVPLASHRDTTGRWSLDEVDLLRVAAASHGGVVFTPGVPDVETVGLGPGLSGIAHLPCVVTPYNALDHVYGPELSCTRSGGFTPEAIRAVAPGFSGLLRRFRHRDPGLLRTLASNHRATSRAFPAAGWQTMWRELAEALDPEHQDRHRRSSDPAVAR